VSEEKGLVGVVSEQSLLDYVANGNLSDPIKKAFVAEFREVGPDTTLDHLRFILTKNDIAFVTLSEGGKKLLKAIITKGDLLRFVIAK
jgi:CBS domain-containing protein